MKITFHGAAQTVTGSQHLLEINGSKLLLDCGLYQGRRQDTYTRNQTFPFDPRKLDAVIARPYRSQWQPAKPGQERLPRLDLRHPSQRTPGEYYAARLSPRSGTGRTVSQ
jgi:hypothetical protein